MQVRIRTATQEDSKAVWQLMEDDGEIKREYKLNKHFRLGCGVKRCADLSRFEVGNDSRRCE